MKLRLFTLSILFSVGLSILPASYAADTTMAMEQMAEIVISLDNKPSEDDQITLDDIANDYASTDNERILAITIMQLETKIRPADKKSIMKIFTSPSASATERTMAKTLLRFEEKPSAHTRAMLSQWIEE